MKFKETFINWGFALAIGLCSALLLMWVSNFSEGIVTAISMNTFLTLFIFFEITDRLGGFDG